MKLSEAQTRVIEKAKRDIDMARECATYEEYFMKYEAPHCNAAYNTPEKFKARDIDSWNYYKKYWEEHKDGIVLTHCNSRTLVKLEQYGLIEIITDSNGQEYGIDKIKVLNY